MSFAIKNRSTGLIAEWEGKFVIFDTIKEIEDFMSLFPELFDKKNGNPKFIKNNFPAEECINYYDIPINDIQNELELASSNELFLDKNEWLVPVSYTLHGVIKVKADSAMQACKDVQNNPKKYSLPSLPVMDQESYTIAGTIEEAVKKCQELSDTLKKHK